MRIVHEVHVPMSPGGGMDGEHHASVFASECHPNEHPDLPAGMFGGDEAIEIEGNPVYLIKLLEDWLFCLKSSKEAMQKRKQS